MDRRPLVSIICSCYNQSKFVLESLESIKQQTFQNFEIIIWDDASKDNSVEIIESWIEQHPQYSVKFVKHAINQGICKSLNECFKLSKGKYCQLLALDDTLMPWKLERHVAILEESKDHEALVFSDAYLMDDKSNLHQNKFIAYHKHYLSLNSGNFYQDLLSSNFIPAMSVLLKRDVIVDVGLWDEDLIFEDYDMWLRLSKKYDFIFDNEASVNYRLHNNNTHVKLRTNLLLDTYRILLKHSDIEWVREGIKNDVYNDYINGRLYGQEKLYYSKYPPSNLLENLIFKNKSRILFKILRKLIK